MGRIKGTPNNIPTYERMMLRVEKTDECWLWTGAVDLKNGYGKIKDGPTMGYVHRVAYTHEVGLIPKDFTIDHLCKIKICVRPDHLEAVTLKENILRSDSWAAQNARKTECPHGHGPYDKQYKNGWRYCSKCKAEKEMRRRARLKKLEVVDEG